MVKKGKKNNTNVQSYNILKVANLFDVNKGDYLNQDISILALLILVLHSYLLWKSVVQYLAASEGSTH